MNSGKPCPSTPGCTGNLSTYSTEIRHDVGMRLRYLRCNVCGLTPDVGGTDRVPLEFAPERPRGRRIRRQRKSKK